MIWQNFQDWTPITFGTETKESGTNSLLILSPTDDNDIKIVFASRKMAHLIIQKRIEQNLSRDQLAKKCGFSVNSLKNYENAKGTIDNEHLLKLSEILNVSLTM